MKWKVRVGWKGSIWRARDRERERRWGLRDACSRTGSHLCEYGGQGIVLTPFSPSVHCIVSFCTCFKWSPFAPTTFLRTHLPTGSTTSSDYSCISVALTLLCGVFDNNPSSFPPQSLRTMGSMCWFVRKSVRSLGEAQDPAQPLARLCNFLRSYEP